MKRIIMLLGAFLIGGYATSTQAVCSYRLLRAPNGKFILVLGDIHTDKYTRNFDVFIECLINSKLSQPLEVLVEVPEELSQGEWKAAPNFERLLELIKSTDKKITDTFTFIRCEPRGYLSERLEKIRERMVDIVMSVVSNDVQEEHYSIELSGRIGTT